MALALGTAMVKTGLADTIAWGVINGMRPMGLIGIMAGLYLLTSVMAAYITYTASVAIILPISLTTALNLGVNPVPFALLVAAAAAANFITPHGYQTNLMVYGPGGYKFKDFMKIGLPLTLVYAVVAIGVLYVVFL
jgi:di/tricarboxylate transporter